MSSELGRASKRLRERRAEDSAYPDVVVEGGT